MKQIRILLADDHNVMRGGLRLLLERQPGFKVVKEASDGRQAVEQAEATRPDIAVLDIAMPNLSGIEAAQRISALLPQTRIIILSMHRDESYVLIHFAIKLFLFAPWRRLPCGSQQPRSDFLPEADRFPGIDYCPIVKKLVGQFNWPRDFTRIVKRNRMNKACALFLHTKTPLLFNPV